MTAPRHVRRPGIATHRSPLTDDDRAVIDGIPVTSLARTIVDLADVLHERRLADAVHEAEVQRILDVNESSERWRACRAAAAPTGSGESSQPTASPR